MAQRHGGYRDAVILIDHRIRLAVDGNESQLKAHPVHEERHGLPKHGFKATVRIHREGGCAATHAQRGYQPKDAQRMVGMEVGEEYGVHPLYSNATARHLHLRTLAAVYQKKPVAMEYCMGRRATGARWLCAAATQYRNIKSHRPTRLESCAKDGIKGNATLGVKPLPEPLKLMWYAASQCHSREL